MFPAMRAFLERLSDATAPAADRTTKGLERACAVAELPWFTHHCMPSRRDTRFASPRSFELRLS